ncbi:peptidase C39 family protein [Micromonospora sp. NPDC049799]|uniref:peptidase C39 family protein n=1 Tax=Micromonospora sp. NPDC049799 TaxID=3154741 RepID=UPI0033FC4E4C
MISTTPTTGRDITYRGFRFPDSLDSGVAEGLEPSGRSLVLAEPAGLVDRTGPDGRLRRHVAGRWTSAPVEAGFAVREVVPSWTADTPGDSWLRVEARGWGDDGAATGWYVLADWAAADHAVRRTSVPGQRDGVARVDTDTLVLAGAAVTGWQLRVTLLRPEDAIDGPLLHTVGAVASGTHPGPTGPTPGPAGAPVAWGTVLDVPRYSQRLHAGVQGWGGGGDSWCSPTCISMVLAYWGAAPPGDRYAWVDPPGPRPVVVHAARHCFDHAYGGAGNWPFNTAYAGLHGVDAFVTRLRSLAEAEAFVAAGIPLVVSAAFRAGQVPGLDYDTAGHLMVLVGFTSTGDPVLNDPYAPDDDGVRRTVPRGPFEAAWQAGSGGVAYVLRPPGFPLPPPPAQPNW